MRKERESLNGDLLHMQHSALVHHGKLCTVSLNGSTTNNYTNANTLTHTQRGSDGTVLCAVQYSTILYCSVRT